MSDAKNFQKLNKETLVDFAEFQEVDSSGTKEEIAERLVDAGYTMEDYELVYGGQVQSEKPEPVGNKPEKEVLICMTRKNPTFQVYGLHFSKEHPFAIVSEDVASKLVSLGGFRVADPKEAAEYYE